MNRQKPLVSLLLAITILIAQVGIVFAAASKDDTSPIAGTIQSITLKTNIDTGVTTVIVTLHDGKKTLQTAELSVETAASLGLIITDEYGIPVLDENGLPVVNSEAIGGTLQIDPEAVISHEEETLHPVGSSLSLFFSDITDYDTIMTAHQDGFGFGVISQALWLTKKLNGDSSTLLAILEAKKTGDFSAFILADGTIPANWGQFKKALNNGEKKNNLGAVKSNGNNGNNGNNGDNGNGNNGNGNGNGNDKEKKK